MNTGEEHDLAASTAKPKSLAINLFPNPPVYPLEDGTFGSTPGTGLYESVDQQRPVLELIILSLEK